MSLGESQLETTSSSLDIASITQFTDLSGYYTSTTPDTSQESEQSEELTTYPDFPSVTSISDLSSFFTSTSTPTTSQNNIFTSIDDLDGYYSVSSSPTDTSLEETSTEVTDESTIAFTSSLESLTVLSLMSSTPTEESTQDSTQEQTPTESATQVLSESESFTSASNIPTQSISSSDISSSVFTFFSTPNYESSSTQADETPTILSISDESSVFQLSSEISSDTLSSSIQVPESQSSNFFSSVVLQSVFTTYTDEDNTPSSSEFDLTTSISTATFSSVTQSSLVDDLSESYVSSAGSQTEIGSASSTSSLSATATPLTESSISVPESNVNSESGQEPSASSSMIFSTGSEIVSDSALPSSSLVESETTPDSSSGTVFFSSEISPISGESLNTPSSEINSQVPTTALADTASLQSQTSEVLSTSESNIPISIVTSPESSNFITPQSTFVYESFETSNTELDATSFESIFTETSSLQESSSLDVAPIQSESTQTLNSPSPTEDVISSGLATSSFEGIATTIDTSQFLPSSSGIIQTSESQFSESQSQYTSQPFPSVSSISLSETNTILVSQAESTTIQDSSSLTVSTSEEYPLVSSDQASTASAENSLPTQSLEQTSSSFQDTNTNQFQSLSTESLSASVYTSEDSQLFSLTSSLSSDVPILTTFSVPNFIDTSQSSSEAAPGTSILTTSFSDVEPSFVQPTSIFAQSSEEFESPSTSLQTEVESSQIVLSQTTRSTLEQSLVSNTLGQSLAASTTNAELSSTSTTPLVENSNGFSSGSSLVDAQPSTELSLVSTSDQESFAIVPTNQQASGSMAGSSTMSVLSLETDTVSEFDSSATRSPSDTQLPSTSSAILDGGATSSLQENSFSTGPVEESTLALASSTLLSTGTGTISDTPETQVLLSASSPTISYLSTNSLEQPDSTQSSAIFLTSLDSPASTNSIPASILTTAPTEQDSISATSSLLQPSVTSENTFVETTSVINELPSNTATSNFLSSDQVISSNTPLISDLETFTSPTESIGTSETVYSTSSNYPSASLTTPVLDTTSGISTQLNSDIFSASRALNSEISISTSTPLESILTSVSSDAEILAPQSSSRAYSQGATVSETFDSNSFVSVSSRLQSESTLPEASGVTSFSTQQPQTSEIRSESTALAPSIMTSSSQLIPAVSSSTILQSFESPNSASFLLSSFQTSSLADESITNLVTSLPSNSRSSPQETVTPTELTNTPSESISQSFSTSNIANIGSLVSSQQTGSVSQSDDSLESLPTPVSFSSSRVSVSTLPTVQTTETSQESAIELSQSFDSFIVTTNAGTASGISTISSFPSSFITSRISSSGIIGEITSFSPTDSGADSVQESPSSYGTVVVSNGQSFSTTVLGSVSALQTPVSESPNSFKESTIEISSDSGSARSTETQSGSLAVGTESEFVSSTSSKTSLPFTMSTSLVTSGALVSTVGISSNVDSSEFAQSLESQVTSLDTEISTFGSPVSSVLSSDAFSTIQESHSTTESGAIGAIGLATGTQSSSFPTGSQAFSSNSAKGSALSSNRVIQSSYRSQVSGSTTSIELQDGTTTRTEQGFSTPSSISNSEGNRGTVSSQRQLSANPTTRTAGSEQVLSGATSTSTDSQTINSDAAVDPPTSLTSTVNSPTSSDWLPDTLIIQSSASPVTGSTETASSTSADATTLPSTLPRVISPFGNDQSQPADSTLIQIGFQHPLNYPFVVSHPLSAAQIFQYLPEGLAHGLGIDSSNISMRSIEPYETSDSTFVKSVAMAYIPTSEVNELQSQISNPNSRLYQNPTPAIKALMDLIDPTVPLSPSNSNSDGLNSGNTNSATSASPSGSTSPEDNKAGLPDSGSLDQPVSGNTTVDSKTAGIAVGAVAGAAAYCGAIFMLTRHYRQKKNNIELENRDSPELATGGPSTQSQQNPTRNRLSPLSPNNRPPISVPVRSENSLGWT